MITSAGSAGSPGVEGPNDSTLFAWTTSPSVQIGGATTPVGIGIEPSDGGFQAFFRYAADRFRDRPEGQVNDVILRPVFPVESDKFLADNKSKTGIKVLPSGVQYRVIEEGTGTQHPTVNSEVTVHYRGSLMNGLEFDSSFARGEPVHFKVGDVIKGWQDVLPLMRVGDHWQIFVPAALAYGERGQPPRIGPNEALVFELKLVDIK